MAETKNQDKGEYTKPTSQLDLEARMARGNLPEHLAVSNEDDDARNPEVTLTPYATEDMDTSGYRGVSSEYMTYSDDTSKPLTADEGPEYEAQKRLESGVAGVRKTLPIDNEPATEVGVGNLETINTAVSGSGFSAFLVDAPADAAGPAPIMPGETGTKAPATSKAAPATGRSAKSTS